MSTNVKQWGEEVAERCEMVGLNAEQLQLLGTSEFLARMAQRDRLEFQGFVASESYTQALTPSQIQNSVADLAQAFPANEAERSRLPAFQSAVRALRYNQQRIIVWRHLARRSTHVETVTALSALADALLQVCLDWCDALLVSAEGEPRDESGRRQHLVIFALGKLGGCELNLSSDIDLICAYPEPGKTSKSGKTNQQYFVLLVQLLLKALGENTGDGFGFRIDLRLRPYGDSGPIVQPFAAMERYFETSGRDWERYALIKARACAGATEEGALLLQRLRPFVYRRYLDFAAIASMREMRALIRRDHSTHSNNVKLCAGGIRDVEFLVQMLQLIWGGRVVALRTNSLAAALDALVEANLLDAAERSTLWSSYEFSRHVEHCLQAFRDEQTHSLPESADDQLRLATAMGFDSYRLLEAELRAMQRRVLVCVDRWLDDEADESGGRDVVALPEDGEQLAGRAMQVIADLRGAAERSPESLVAERLERLLPLLLDDLRASRGGEDDAPLDVVLLRLEPLLKNVLRRSAYLVLLSENSGVRHELVTIARAGDYFTGLLAKFPALLEELFMRINLAAVPEHQDLREELDVLLPRDIASDLQQQHFDRLAQYKSQHQFRCLLALSRGDLTVMQMADYLTRLAESVLEVVLRWAWASVRGSSSSAVPERFVVIGYGKLGGFELGAGSDLDLVFLHDQALSEQGTFHQLTRRILSYLAMQTYFGPLYEVDVRLRPAGRDGTMVSTLAGFETYQEKTAWLWEHQALLRARTVAGCERLAEDFNRVRRNVVGASRDLDETRQQIVLMRERMREGIAANTLALRLKQGEGGIVDIEFMVQYLALGFSATFPSLLEFTDNARILEQAATLELLPQRVSEQLIADYAQLRHTGQMLIVSPTLSLAPKGARSAHAEDVELHQRVAALWQQLMIEGRAPNDLTLPRS